MGETGGGGDVVGVLTAGCCRIQLFETNGEFLLEVSLTDGLLWSKSDLER